MYLSAFSRNIKDSLLNFWNILAKCCVVTGSIFSRLRTNTSIIKSWHLTICRGLLDITMINEVILQLGCLFNYYDQAWYWPKKKNLENHNFGKKSFILDKKQTEKLSWRRLKKSEFWLKPEKSHACMINQCLQWHIVVLHIRYYLFIGFRNYCKDRIWRDSINGLVWLNFSIW